MERQHGLLILQTITIHHQGHAIDMGLKGVTDQNLQQLPRTPLTQHIPGWIGAQQQTLGWIDLRLIGKGLPTIEQGLQRSRIPALTEGCQRFTPPVAIGALGPGQGQGWGWGRGWGQGRG